MLKMDTTNELELIDSLRRDNYCLMTDEAGAEIYDEHGNLLVCKSKSGECVPIPNSDGIRNLYELPLKAKPGSKKVGEIYGVSVNKNNSAIILQEKMDDCGDTSFVWKGTRIEQCLEGEKPFVWTGQRVQRSRDATTALIEILDSPTYLQLMRDKNTIKLIVWEKIATELQNQGFRIAKTVKEAGMRTFQKWRNMERTYWRYYKNPDQSGDDRRKKKPYYYDAMDVFIKKKNRSSPSGYRPINEPNLFSMDQEMDIGLTTEVEYTTTDILASDQSVSTPIVSVEEPANEEIAEETVNALVQLMVADTYRDLFNGRKIVAWEKISDDLAELGFVIPGSSIRKKSQALFLKWKTIKKSFLKYQKYQHTNCDLKKPPYYDILLKATSKQTLKDADLSAEELVNPADDLQIREHNDHDYYGRRYSIETENLAPSPTPSVECCDSEIVELTTQSTAQPSVPNHSSTFISSANSNKPEFCLPKPTLSHITRVRSCEVLQQMKALQESALVVQQQNFSKMISLLEEQVRQQQTLNLLFTQYVQNQTNVNRPSKKRRSKVLYDDENLI